MNKKNVVIIVLIALITLGFVFGILAVVDREKGYPPGMQWGTTFTYWYDGFIFGTQVPNTIIHGELYSIVSGYNPLLKQIEMTTINHWYNGSTEHIKNQKIQMSELVPTLPLFIERNSSLGGISGQKSGEFLGWILPRDYSPGFFVNNYFLEKKALISSAAGTFSTNVFTKANISRDANNLITSELSTLQYEQWSGVLVHAENIFTVYNASSGEILFFEYEYAFLTTFTNYNWPAMTTLMPILSIADPIIQIFSTYALIILIILLIVAIVVLWKKSSSYR